MNAVAFSGANSRAYLSAVFAAYRSGDLVVSLPKTPEIRSVPGVEIVDRQGFSDDPGWFEEPFDLIAGEAPAQISFSSGTTGRPKAILLPHRALSDVVTRINTAMELDSGVREYVGVPVTFSFGFGRVRAVAAARGASYLPENGFDPSEIARMLQAGEINAVSAVPTLWRLVLSNPDVIGSASSKLRWIEIGSQYMSGAEKTQLRRLFPNARIVQHYGLTEASRTTLLDISQSEEAVLESVGRAEGDVEIGVAEDGTIRTRGPHVALGLVTGAGVKPVTDQDGWLITSDRGRIEDGYLYYEGRTDELINSGGLKIDPTQFEQRLAAQVADPDAIAVGRADDPLRGEVVLVAVRQDSDLPLRKVEDAAVSVAEGFGLKGRGSVVVQAVSSIPRTATGKVRRADLAVAYTAELNVPVVPTETPAEAGQKSTELQALWAEILGVDSVRTDQSFYDLGGDSLSALTAIMRMEAMGLDADTARGIFDGKTIAEIVGARPQSETSGVSSSPTPTLENGRAAELQSLWAEILGVDSVRTDQSFYDLGGDSLSALTAIMRMEAMGLDADTARGIFDGKTIADLAGGEAPTPAPSVPRKNIQPAPAPNAAKTQPKLVVEPGGLTLAETMNTVHAVRGVLILWVVVVHWLPGVLERINLASMAFHDALIPAFRYGTPGFAMVFGIGMGALGIAHFRSNRALYLKGMRFNTVLIVVGMIALALVKAGVLWTEGRLGDRLALSIMFYSAISYYALAMLAMPLIMRILNLGQNTLITIVAAAVGSMVVHDVLHWLFAATKPVGILELVKVLFTAKYGFFRMTGYVMIGVLIGWVFRQSHGRAGLVRDLATLGLVLIGLGGLLLYRVQPDDLIDSFNLPELWHMSLYAGVTLVLLAGFCLLNRNGGTQVGSGWRKMNAFAIASGILALPIFVGHELVVPLKALLEAAGTPELVALVLPLIAFLAVMAGVYLKLMRFLVK
jgi:acyl-coenzyme A synthetase/AMP-(fatty) acid ligase/acyl carrier protein